MQQRPTNSFSGGWRMRIALSLALFINPDVLLREHLLAHWAGLSAFGRAVK